MKGRNLRAMRQGVNAVRTRAANDAHRDTCRLRAPPIIRRMDRIKALEIFKAVAERGSFVKAADALDLSTAVVTRAVQDLEKLLGARLLQRTTRRMSLTPEGREVLQRADVVLGAFDALTAAADAGASKLAGDIRFSAPVSLGAHRLAEMIGAFIEQHPAVRVELLLDDLPVNLVAHGVDLGIAVTWDLPPEVIARRIGAARVGVYGAPGYLRRRGTPRHPQELARHDCLVCTGGGRRPWHFSHPVTGERIEPAIEPRLWANNANALLAAAVQDSGLALLPHALAERCVREGRLQPVLSHWSSPTLGIFLVYMSRDLPARVRALMGHVAQYFEDRDALVAEDAAEVVA
jgi:LysR family transcriptional regulator for bpeEF and oprC